MASRTRSRSRGLGALAGLTSRTASAAARASPNATAYERDTAVRRISMPNPLCLALDYSPCALMGQRGSGVWDPVRCARPHLLQVAELGPGARDAETLRPVAKPSTDLPGVTLAVHACQNDHEAFKRSV